MQCASLVGVKLVAGAGTGQRSNGARAAFMDDLMHGRKLAAENATKEVLPNAVRKSLDGRTAEYSSKDLIVGIAALHEKVIDFSFICEHVGGTLTEVQKFYCSELDKLTMLAVHDRLSHFNDLYLQGNLDRDMVAAYYSLLGGSQPIPSATVDVFQLYSQTLLHGGYYALPFDSVYRSLGGQPDCNPTYLRAIYRAVLVQYEAIHVGPSLFHKYPLRTLQASTNTIALDAGTAVVADNSMDNSGISTKHTREGPPVGPPTGALQQHGCQNEFVSNKPGLFQKPFATAPSAVLLPPTAQPQTNASARNPQTMVREESQEPPSVTKESRIESQQNNLFSVPPGQSYIGECGAGSGTNSLEMAVKTSSGIGLLQPTKSVTELDPKIPEELQLLGIPVSSDHVLSDGNNVSDCTSKLRDSVGEEAKASTNHLPRDQNEVQAVEQLAQVLGQNDEQNEGPTTECRTFSDRSPVLVLGESQNTLSSKLRQNGSIPSQISAEITRGSHEISQNVVPSKGTFVAMPSLDGQPQDDASHVEDIVETSGKEAHVLPSYPQPLANSVAQSSRDVTTGSGRERISAQGSLAGRDVANANSFAPVGQDEHARYVHGDPQHTLSVTEPARETSEYVLTDKSGKATAVVGSQKTACSFLKSGTPDPNPSGSMQVDNGNPARKLSPLDELVQITAQKRNSMIRGDAAPLSVNPATRSIVATRNGDKQCLISEPVNSALVNSGFHQAKVSQHASSFSEPVTSLKKASTGHDELKTRGLRYPDESSIREQAQRFAKEHIRTGQSRFRESNGPLSTAQSQQYARPMSNGMHQVSHHPVTRNSSAANVSVGNSLVHNQWLQPAAPSPPFRGRAEVSSNGIFSQVVSGANPSARACQLLSSSSVGQAPAMAQPLLPASFKTCRPVQTHATYQLVPAQSYPAGNSSDSETARVVAQALALAHAKAQADVQAFAQLRQKGATVAFGQGQTRAPSSSDLRRNGTQVFPFVQSTGYPVSMGPGHLASKQYVSEIQSGHPQSRGLRSTETHLILQQQQQQHHQQQQPVANISVANGAHGSPVAHGFPSNTLPSFASAPPLRWPPNENPAQKQLQAQAQLQAQFASQFLTQFKQPSGILTPSPSQNSVAPSSMLSPPGPTVSGSSGNAKYILPAQSSTQQASWNAAFTVVPPCSSNNGPLRQNGVSQDPADADSRRNARPASATPITSVSPVTAAQEAFVSTRGLTSERLPLSQQNRHPTTAAHPAQQSFVRAVEEKLRGFDGGKGNYCTSLKYQEAAARAACAVGISLISEDLQNRFASFSGPHVIANIRADFGTDLRTHLTETHGENRSLQSASSPVDLFDLFVLMLRFGGFQIALKHNHLKLIAEHMRVNTPVSADAIASIYVWFLGTYEVRFVTHTIQRPPLLVAVLQKNVGRASALLGQGAEIDFTDVEGNSALHVAAYEGCLSLTEHLLARDAEVNLANSQGVTPLVLAINSGHALIVDILLECGADMSVLPADGNTCLFYAVTKKSVTICNILLEFGADANEIVKPSLGFSALHVAVLRESADIVELLLRYKANVNATDAHDRTPLHFASYSGNIAIALVLLENGADPLRTTKSGNSGSRIALKRNHKVLGALLCGFESLLDDKCTITEV